MTIEERRVIISEKIETRGRKSWGLFVAELAKEMNVSEITILRDLNFLRKKQKKYSLYENNL